MQNHSAPSLNEAPSKSARLKSLDVLRGFDMFWIIGGDILIRLLAALSGWDLLRAAAVQITHAEWEGVHAYDLVFPLFMFIAGVSLTLSFARNPAKATQRLGRMRAVGKRFVILLLLGVIYNFGWDISLDRFRLASVLGLIGGSYFFAAAIILYIPKQSARALVLLLICVVMACLQLLVPVPGFGAGVLTAEGAINGWIDRLMLPGMLYGGTYDPEGILAIFSGTAITLAGALIGQQLVTRMDLPKACAKIVIIGAIVLIAGSLLASVYPPIKKIWTPSFVLIAIGASSILLGVFVYLVDVRNWSRWTRAFEVIGVNSIAIYLAARFVTYPVFELGYLASGSSYPTGTAIIIALIGAELAILNWMYSRRIFIKV